MGKKALRVERARRVRLLEDLWHFRYDRLGDQLVLPRVPWLRGPGPAERRRVRRLLARVDWPQFERRLAKLDEEFLHPSTYLSAEELDLLERCQRPAEESC